MTYEEAEKILNKPESFTLVEWARMSLSMAVKERKYLGKWIRDGKALENAKEKNKQMQDAARVILYADSENKSRTIWYFDEAPTLGNNFRAKYKR